jgi:ribosome-associated translation inhibitor RaiA
MAVEIQITFRGISPFEAARDIVHEKLQRMSARLPADVRCHVVVEPALDASDAARVHARVHLLGTGLLVSTEADERDETSALRTALARAEASAPRVSDKRAEEHLAV